MALLFHLWQQAWSVQVLFEERWTSQGRAGSDRTGTHGSQLEPRSSLGQKKFQISSGQGWPAVGLGCGGRFVFRVPKHCPTQTNTGWGCRRQSRSPPISVHRAPPAVISVLRLPLQGTRTEGAGQGCVAHACHLIHLPKMHLLFPKLVLKWPRTRLPLEGPWCPDSGVLVPWGLFAGAAPPHAGVS